VTGYCESGNNFLVIIGEINNNSNYCNITSALEATIVKWSEVSEGRYRVAAHGIGLNSVILLSSLLLFSYDMVLR